jgi:hypothetical protein
LCCCGSTRTKGAQDDNNVPPRPATRHRQDPVQDLDAVDIGSSPVSSLPGLNDGINNLFEVVG